METDKVDDDEDTLPVGWDYEVVITKTDKLDDDVENMKTDKLDDEVELMKTNKLDDEVENMQTGNLDDVENMKTDMFEENIGPKKRVNMKHFLKKGNQPGSSSTSTTKRAVTKPKQHTETEIDPDYLTKLAISLQSATGSEIPMEFTRISIPFGGDEDDDDDMPSIKASIQKSVVGDGMDIHLTNSRGASSTEEPELAVVDVAALIEKLMGDGDPDGLKPDCFDADGWQQLKEDFIDCIFYHAAHGVEYDTSFAELPGPSLCLQGSFNPFMGTTAT